MNLTTAIRSVLTTTIVAGSAGAGLLATAGPAAAAPAPVAVNVWYSSDYQTFVVPDGVTSLHLTVAGGAGGDGPSTICGGLSEGGYGSRVTSDLSVTPGQRLVMFVGEGGHLNGNGGVGAPAGAVTGGRGGSGGGGNSQHGGGGGAASYVWDDHAGNWSVLLAGGGGGGGGGQGADASLCGGRGGDAGRPAYRGGTSSSGFGFPGGGGATDQEWTEGRPGNAAATGSWGGGGGGGGAGFNGCLYAVDPCHGSGGGGGAGSWGGGGGGAGGGGAGGTSYAAFGASNVTYDSWGAHGATGKITIGYVPAPLATSTTVASSFSMVGGAATLSATVAPASASSGTVSFSDGGTPIPGCGAQRLLSGADPANTAYCTTSALTAGQHDIVATYSGDSDDAPSTGHANWVVTKYPTTTTLSGPASGTTDERPSFIVNVAYLDGAGSVSVTVDGTPVPECQALPLTDDTGMRYHATCAPSGWTVGTHTLVAAYSGSSRYTNSTATLTYTVMPGQPALSISGASTTEGNRGSHPLPFTVTLSRSSTVPVTVVVSTASASATAGSDYVSRSLRITIPAGSTRRVVDVRVKGDSTVESNEFFMARLSGATDAVYAVTQARGVIVNDD